MLQPHLQGLANLTSSSSTLPECRASFSTTNKAWFFVGQNGRMGIWMIRDAETKSTFILVTGGNTVQVITVCYKKNQVRSHWSDLNASFSKLDAYC